MVILNFAKIENDLCSGADVVIPRHIKAQAKNADVALVNVNNIKIDGVSGQIEYKKDFDIRNFPKPFDKPDLAVFQELYNIEYIRIYKNLKKNNIPYIIVPHGEMSKGSQSKKHLKKLAANILVFNGLINNATAVHCLSKEEAENTKFRVNKFVCTNGVLKQEKVKEEFNKDKTKIVYIGRLEVYIKGIDIMLEAIAKDKEFLIENNCTLDIYGPDIEGRRAEIEKLIVDNNIGELVSIYDAVTGEEKAEKYLESDIFIQTSRTEGMPVGLLEALSFGMPCIATKGTNLGELIEEYDAGWKSENNFEDLAAVIKKAILDKDKLKEKSHNAIKLVEENFSWDEISKKLSKTYFELIK